MDTPVSCMQAKCPYIEGVPSSGGQTSWNGVHGALGGFGYGYEKNLIQVIVQFVVRTAGVCVWEHCHG